MGCSARHTTDKNCYNKLGKLSFVKTEQEDWFGFDKRPIIGYNRNKDWENDNKWVVNKRIENKTNDIEEKFNDLVAKWKKETGHLSTTLHITRNENYLRIIGLGPEGIPLILREMRREPDYWFEALRILTAFNPVKRESLGDIDNMTQDWISWAQEKRII